MKTSHLKTKVELLKFRFKVLFFGWLTLTILSIPTILKYDQMVNHSNDTFETVAKFQGCVFVDKMGLQKSSLLPQPCKGYTRFLEIKSVAKTQKFLDFAPIYSLIFMFIGFAIVLQNKGKNDGL